MFSFLNRVDLFKFVLINYKKNSLGIRTKNTTRKTYQNYITKYSIPSWLRH